MLPLLYAQHNSNRIPTMKKLGVIGCGLRSHCYLYQLRDRIDRDWQLSALADPNPVAIDVYQRNYGNSSVRTFASGPELLKAMGHELDAVIIASPNTLHLESLLPSLEKGLIIVLEKPIATTIEDCVTMWQAYVKAGSPPLAVGFVLRYTSFYGAVKQMLDSGEIGQVLSIEATELLGPPLTSLFMRTWRRWEELTGSFILEKCCHDMDLLNWFVGAPARQVSSFATRTRFVPNPEAAMHCCDCKLKDSCRYNALSLNPYIMNVSGRHEVEALIPSDDLCVFNSDKDVPDHQVVNIEFENGVLATFTACMDQPKTTRTIKIDATNGQIVGDFSEDYLEVRQHAKNSAINDYRTRQIKIEHDDSGHHGGDSVLSNQIRAMLRNQPTPPLAGLKEGIEACLIAFAAEQSRREKKIVDMKGIFAKVE